MTSNTTSSTTMPSSPSNEVPASSNTNSPRFLRFIKMRPMARAAKKVASKIKSLPIFRACMSVPLECEVKYTEEQVHEMGSSNAHSDVSVQEGAEGFLAKILPIADDVDGAQVQDDQRKVSPAEISTTPVGNVLVSPCNRKSEDSCVNIHTGAGAPGVHSPADKNNFKETRIVSQAQESESRNDPRCHMVASSDAVENVDAEAIEEEAVPSGSCQTDAEAKEKLTGASSSISSTVLLDSELIQRATTAESFDLSSETVETVVSHNVAEGVVHEVKDAHHEIDSKPASQSPVLESDILQKETYDLSTNKTSAEGSSLGSGVQNDTPSALQSIATGNGAKERFETDGKVDDVALYQNSNKKKTPTLGNPDGYSKADDSNIDQEKAKRIERRRRLLAKKKEARLLWAMENAARVSAKIEISRSEGSEVKSTSNRPPIVSEKAHAEAASSENMKSENENADGTEEASERARWSREEAQEARDRRKRNQKQRLLNLMAICNAMN